MKVNFFATLRPIVNGKSVEVAAEDGTTVEQLLELLFERYPPLRSELLDEDGQLFRHVHVFVNGRDAPYLEKGLQTMLTQSDTINIFPPVGGGSA